MVFSPLFGSWKSALVRGRSSPRGGPGKSRSAAPSCLRVEALEDRTLMSAGALDTTFGTGGIVTTAFFNRNDVLNDVKIQGDGKIVAAGKVYIGSGYNYYDFGVARYNADGTLDS